MIYTRNCTYSKNIFIDDEKNTYSKHLEEFILNKIKNCIQLVILYNTAYRKIFTGRILKLRQDNRQNMK